VKVWFGCKGLRIPAIACLPLGVVAGLLVGCGSSPPEPPPPSPILVAAPRSCPIGITRGTSVSSDDVTSALGGHVPRWLPVSFGIATSERFGEGSVLVTWTDRLCREFTINFHPGQSADPTPGPHLGAWTVAYNVPHQCGNSILGASKCLGYQADTQDGSVNVELIGVGRPEGDRIVRSIPLG
jgi:hypothetical protein